MLGKQKGFHFGWNIILDLGKGLSRLFLAFRLAGGWGRIAVLIVVVMFFSLPRAAEAQQLTLQTYGKQEGVTNTAFSCLIQNKIGYVFACTEHGIYVHDGVRFYNLSVRQGLPDGGFTYDLTFDDAGRVIIRYPNGLYVSTTPIGTHTPPELLWFRPAIAKAISIRGNGVGHIVPWPGGAVFESNGALFLVHTGGDGKPPWVEHADSLLRRNIMLDDMTPLAVEGSMLWAVRTDGRICGFGRSKSRCFGPADGLPSEHWLALLPTGGGRIAARSATRLAIIDTRGGQVMPSILPDQSGRDPNYPYTLSLAVTPAGHLVTQSAGGLMVQSATGWTSLTAQNGLPSVRFMRLMFDQAGELWFGALGAGVMRTVGFGRWENFNHLDGLSSNVTWQMVRQPGGPLWVATDGGVDAFAPSSGVPDPYLHLPGAAFSIALDGAGHLWRSVGSTGLACVTLATGGTVRFELPQVNQMLRVSAGLLWFLSNKGVFEEKITAVPTMPVLVPALSGSAPAATVAADGTIWVLQGTILTHRHAGGKIVPISFHWPQPGFDPYTLSAGPAGVMWIAGGGGGLYRLHLDGDRLLGADHIVPPDIVSSTIMSLMVDHRGWLWVGTDSGVSAFDGRRWVSANSDVGLIWDDLDQGALFEDVDGSIWIGTSQGLSHLLHPDSLFERRELKPVITFATVGGVPYRERAVPFAREPFVLQFGVLGSGANGTTRFRYRLDGVDKDWVETGSGSVRYPSVPPGHHRFELVAFDPLSHAVSPPASILFRMKQPWWFWWPMFVLYAATVAGTGYGLLRLRVRFLVRQRRALLREVELRTAQIREAQATDSLTGLLVRGEVQGRLECALADRERPQLLCVGLLDIDHFKRINDRFGHLVGDEVLEELGRRLKRALRPGEYAGRYGGEEILVVLEGALSVGERMRALRDAVCGDPFPMDGIAQPVTCSIGVAIEQPRDGWKTLIGRADKALYQAKADGRDRIVHFRSDPGPRQPLSVS